MNIDTQLKGDLGVAKVIADLSEKGIGVALPISQHLPYDLIAISKDNKLARISVKHIKITKNLIAVPLRTISSNSKGYKIKIVNLNAIEAYAIYCPDTKQVYYIQSKEMKGLSSCFSLNIGKPQHNIKFHAASDYLNVEKIFYREMVESGLIHQS